MSDTPLVDFEVIIGTEYTNPDDRDLAIATAADALGSAYPSASIWRVNTYDDEADESNIGVGFNVEVPEDEAADFSDSMGRHVETIERI